MTQKIKKEVYIDSEQDARLKWLSKFLGISEDELIERAIGSYLVIGNHKEESEAARPQDRRAWLKELEFMESRIEGRETGDGYPHRLTREEMYDEIMRERGLYR